MRGAKVRVLIPFLAAVLLPAQTPQASFAVTSVKANHSIRNGINNHFTKTQISWTNTPLIVLIENAYRLRDYQVLGGPAWIKSDKWDIDGNSETEITYKLRDEMMASLLADRFQLKFHRETRDMPAYRVVAGKGPFKGIQIKDGEVRAQRAGISNRPGEITGYAAPLQQLAAFISSDLGVPVLDATGITGNFDFRLKWTRDETDRSFDKTDAMEPGPSLFTAIQEQLGLKLEAIKTPVEVLVIDKVEKPAEN